MTGNAMRRMLLSWQAVFAVLVAGLVLLVAFAWGMQRERDVERLIERFILEMFIPLVIPVASLCFASSCIARERQEKTLVYLLASPTPRWLVFLSKVVAAALLSASLTAVAFTGLFLASNLMNAQAALAMLPGIVLGTLAYVCLFGLLSVVFQRATIIGLVYTFFLENLVGNIPGIAKRVAISFYIRCYTFEAAAPFGIGPAGSRNEEVFQPVDGWTAAWALAGIAVGAYLAGAVIFSRREYV